MKTGASAGIPAGRERAAVFGALMAAALAASGLGGQAKAEDRQNHLSQLDHGPAPGQFDWGRSIQFAQADPREKAFNIPAQPLTSALTLFGQQSGLQVAIDGALARNLSTLGVVGTMTLDQAVRRLLAGTGLTYKLADDTTIVIEEAVEGDGSPVLLDPITVEGRTSLEQVEIGNLPPAYAGGQVARGGDLGMLGKRDIMDTPFSINSYTAQTIQDQQARTVADVMINDPSVRATHSSGGILDSFFIRGFPINEGNLGEIAFDGVFGVAPSFRLFTDYAERVEVIKGPTALLNGIAPNSSVGGTINVVPKRAPSVDLTRITTSYTTELQGGGHLDVGRRFGADREFGIRFNASYYKGDLPVEEESREAPTGALALDYQGERFRATVDAIAQREEITAPQRPLFPIAGIEIPDAPNGRRNIQQTWESSQIDDLSGLGRIEYDLDDTVTLFAAGGGGHTRVERLFGTPVLLNSDGDATITPQNFIFDVDRATAELGFRARFSTGALAHALTFQGNGLKQRLKRGLNSGTAQSTNIFDPADRPEQDVPTPGRVPTISENEFFGVGLSDTVSVLDERVQLTLGVRRQQIDTENFSPTTGEVTSSSNEGEFTALLGLLVKPWENVSLYANYTEGLSVGDTAPAIAANAGETLSPARSEQIEVGAKVDFDDLAVTLSLFQIERPFGQLENNSGALIFSEAGEQRNRGLELNVFGEPIQGLRLLGGLALLDGELTKTSSDDTRGNTPIGVPSLQLNFGSEWDTPFIPGLTLVGNVIHTGDQFVDTANTQKIPSWTRLDLGARYSTTVMDTPITLRATVQNVLDSDYFANVASFGTLSQGAPRTVLLSVTTDF